MSARSIEVGDQLLWGEGTRPIGEGAASPLVVRAGTRQLEIVVVETRPAVMEENGASIAYAITSS